MSALNFRRGFTVIELLIVIAIGTLLLALALPVGFRFYQTQVADENASGVLSALRVAETRARQGYEDTSFGVAFFSDRYVLFGGATYAGRNTLLDQVFPLPSGTIISTPANEVVFAEHAGSSNATGTFTVTTGEISRSFVLESSGVISR